MVNVMELEFEKASVNVDKLHQEIAAGVGTKFIGISTGPSGKVRIHIQDDMSLTDQGKIGPIVAAHDAAKLTVAQQAEADRAAALDALRKPWDQWTAQDQTDFLRILAEQAGLIPVV
jgi:hypothetical protein